MNKAKSCFLVLLLPSLFLHSVLFFFPSSVHAQKVWTLAECVDYAVKNNLTVKRSEVSVGLSEVSVYRNKWGMIPSVNGGMSYGWNVGRSIDPTTNLFTETEIQTGNISLDGNWVLFNGFTLRNTLKSSQLEYMASQQDLLKVKNDISLNVVSSYLQVLYAREQLNLTNAIIEQTQLQLDRTKKMVDAGSMTQGNLLDAESQLSREELARVEAENQYIIAKLNLIQLLQLDSAGDFTIEDPKVDVPPVAVLAYTPEQIYDLSLKHLPEIKGSETRVMGAETDLKVSKGSRYPRLSAYGGLNTNTSSAARALDSLSYTGLGTTSFVTAGGEAILSPTYDPYYSKESWDDQLSNNLSRFFGFSLSIPIVNNMSVESNVRRARLNLEQQKYIAEETRLTVFKSIQQAHADAIAAQKRFQASQKSDLAFEQAFDYADKRYNAGLTSSLEFITAQNNMARTKIEVLQAKYDYIFRVKVLDFYAGNSLVF